MPGAFDTDYGGIAKVQIVFGDRTNGAESYSAGRFLFLDHPTAGSALTAGDSIPITIDFNRAIVPPCGFSNQTEARDPPSRVPKYCCVRWNRPRNPRFCMPGPNEP